MVITGSALFVETGSRESVLKHLKRYPRVTYHASSDSGTELVVNMEAEDLEELENLCAQLKDEVPQVVEIAHIYVNFEEEVEEACFGQKDKRRLKKPKFIDNREL
ncbi:MAG: chaperone NapD [Thermodesulfobacteriota bacterium]